MTQKQVMQIKHILYLLTKTPTKKKDNLACAVVSLNSLLG